MKRLASRLVNPRATSLELGPHRPRAMGRRRRGRGNAHDQIRRFPIGPSPPCRLPHAPTVCPTDRRTPLASSSNGASPFFCISDWAITTAEASAVGAGSPSHFRGRWPFRRRPGRPTCVGIPTHPLICPLWPCVSRDPPLCGPTQLPQSPRQTPWLPYRCRRRSLPPLSPSQGHPRSRARASAYRHGTVVPFPSVHPPPTTTTLKGPRSAATARSSALSSSASAVAVTLGSRSQGGQKCVGRPMGNSLAVAHGQCTRGGPSAVTARLPANSRQRRQRGPRVRPRRSRALV